MKKRKSNIDWKISGEKICWAATILILALLIVILSSCRTHKESTVDYEITSSEAYQERRAEEHGKQLAIRKAEMHDTIKENASQSGRIEIERDTAGRAVKIIYEHIFNGIQTQGSSRIDTVYQKQVIVFRDSIGSGHKDTLIDGKIKEKQDAGWGSWLILCFLMLGFLLFVFTVIYVRVKIWKG